RAIELTDAPVIDFVDAPRLDAEVLSRFSNRWNLMTAYVVAVLDFADDFLRRSFTRQEKGVGHANQRYLIDLGGARRTVGHDAERGGRRARVHEAAKDAAIDVHHALSGRAFVIVA